MPVYTYEFLSLDEMIKNTNELGALFNVEFNGSTQTLGDVKKLRLDADSLTLTYYENGSFEMNLEDPMVSFEDFNNDDLILQTAANL